MAAEKDYADIMLDAVSLLIDKKIESVKFDETINATIVDASKADSGIYIVSTGNAKFTAYSAETKYKNNDAVMVMIPQGNYDNQKIIIGKQVDTELNTPLIYQSPFQQLVNISNNLIPGETSLAIWANDPNLIKGHPWSIEESDFKKSALYERVNSTDFIKENLSSQSLSMESLQNEYKQLVIWDSYLTDGETLYQGYTRLGVQAQFSTWLSEYQTATGNYGLAIELTFKCLDIPDPIHEQDAPNTFVKIINFDSDEFFGDVYNFETYYTQENVYDISEYIDYPITRIRLFAYQRLNFKDLYNEPIPYNDDEIGGVINPNIFIKDCYLCLGIPIEEFLNDTATIFTKDPLVYYKGSLAEQNFNYLGRYLNNQKTIGLRWVHKDSEKDIIKTVQPDEFSDEYEVRWYRYKLGAKSPDQFAGAHWQRYYGQKVLIQNIDPNTGENLTQWVDIADGNGDYYISEENYQAYVAYENNEINSENPIRNFEDYAFATNELEILFNPNVNNASEKIKAIIIKREENNIERLIAVSNVLEFLNDTDVRNNASLVDMNALAIIYTDEDKHQADCLGTYFLYDKSDRVFEDGDKNIRFLTAVFEPEQLNPYMKANLTTFKSIKWTLPYGDDTMIVPAYPPTGAAAPIEDSSSLDSSVVINTESQTIEITGGENDIDKTMVAFFIKKVLNRYAGRNTVKVEVSTDGELYTAETQMVFGSAGTSGSDYTLQLIWKDNKNAIDATPETLENDNIGFEENFGDRRTLIGELALYNQSGQNITDELNIVNETNASSDDQYWDIDWAVSESTVAQNEEDWDIAKQMSYYYYPIYLDESFVTFPPSMELGTENSPSKYYYYLASDIPYLSYAPSNNARIQFSGDDSSLLNFITEQLYIYSLESDSFVSFKKGYNDFVEQEELVNKNINDEQTNLANFLNTTIIENIADFLTMAVDDDADDEIYAHKQLYYKTKGEKNQLVFQPLKNIYSQGKKENHEDDDKLYLSSQANNTATFFNSSISILSNKIDIFNYFTQLLQSQSASFADTWENNLSSLVSKYFDKNIYYKALNSSTWKIKILDDNQTLYSKIPKNRTIPFIDLCQLVFGYKDKLYYEGDSNITIHLDNLNNADIQILREFYKLFYNTSDITIADLKSHILESYISDDDNALKIINFPDNTFVYKTGGINPVFFSSMSYKDFNDILKMSDELSFYQLSLLSESQKIDQLATSSLRNSFLNRSRWINSSLIANGDTSNILHYWINGICSIIDYQEKTEEEILLTKSPYYFKIKDDNDNYQEIRTYFENNGGLTISNINNALNNCYFEGLQHDQIALDGALNQVFFSSVPDPNLNALPGFLMNENTLQNLAREERKYFVNQYFNSNIQIDVGTNFILKAMNSNNSDNSGKMRLLSELTSFNLAQLFQINSRSSDIYLTQESVPNFLIATRNSTDDKTYDYENIFCQLQNALQLTATELGNISTTESNLDATTGTNRDRAYKYGKAIFNTINQYLSYIGQKLVLKPTNDYSELFKLLFYYKENNFNLYDLSNFGDINTNSAVVGRFFDILKFVLKANYAAGTYDFMSVNEISNYNDLSEIGKFRAYDPDGNFIKLKSNYSTLISELTLRDIINYVFDVPSGTSGTYCYYKDNDSNKEFSLRFSKSVNYGVTIYLDDTEHSTHFNTITCEIIDPDSHYSIYDKRLSDTAFISKVNSYLKSVLCETVEDSDYAAPNYAEAFLVSGKNILDIYYGLKNNNDSYNYDSLSQQSQLPLYYLNDKIITPENFTVSASGNDSPTTFSLTSTFSHDYTTLAFSNSANNIHFQVKVNGKSSFVNISDARLNYWICSLLLKNVPSSYPNFLTFMMDMIIKYDNLNGNNDYESGNARWNRTFSTSYGDSNLVKPLTSQSSDRPLFGSSNTTIFFPKNYYNNKTAYSSINYTCQKECYPDSYSGRGTVYPDAEKVATKVLAKVNGKDILMADKEDEYLFYSFLIKYLYKQDISLTNDLKLKTLTSSSSVLWHCYDYHLLSYDSLINYSNGYYYEVSNSFDFTKTKNVLNEFIDSVKAMFTNNIRTLRPEEQEDVVKPLLFEILLNYHRKTDFYDVVDLGQLSNFEDENERLQKRNEICSFIADSYFRKSLDYELYLNSYFNIIELLNNAYSNYNSSMEIRNTVSAKKSMFLRHKFNLINEENMIVYTEYYKNYASSDDLIPEPNAYDWLYTILRSKQVRPFSNGTTFGYTLRQNQITFLQNYFLVTDDAPINVYDFLIEKTSDFDLLEIQKNFFMIYLYDFSTLSNNFTLNGVSVSGTYLNFLNFLIENIDTYFSDSADLVALLNQKESQMIRNLIQEIFDYDLIDFYNVFITYNVDILEKKLYYKIKDADGKILDVINLFQVTDNNYNENLKQINDFINKDIYGYITNTDAGVEDDDDTIYFNYYNSLGKKAFIKRNNRFIVDPYNEYIKSEVYYYPTETTKKVNRALLLQYSLEGNDVLVFPRVNTIDNSSADALLNSLNILQVTLKNFGDYDLVSYFPIPIKNGTEYDKTEKRITYQVTRIEGPDRVWYPMVGSPEYYQNPYQLFAQSYTDKIRNFEEDSTDLTWEVFYYHKQDEHDNFVPTLENNILKPIPIYVKEAKNYGVRCIKNSSILWSQPIYVFQDRYPSTTVNKWNGNSIVLDEEKAMILASAFAAGKKNEDNSFSGVMIGDWSKDDAQDALKAQTGIYGFHRGAVSYAFLEDGTGFIGKDGKGRIWFDGEDSQIYSSSWKYGDPPVGMLIDIDDGFINMDNILRSSYTYSTYSVIQNPESIDNEREIQELQQTVPIGTSTFISIDSKARAYPLQIGINNGGSPSFRVGWAGDIHIEKGSLKGAYIEGSLIKGSDVFTNYLQAAYGIIGGWKINKTSIVSPGQQTDSGVENWTILHPIQGITTNTVKIRTKSNVSDTIIDGQLGFVKGNDKEQDTDGIGITTSRVNIILDNLGTNCNIGIKAGHNLWLEGQNKAVLKRRGEGSDRIEVSSGDISITTNGTTNLKVGTTGAENRLKVSSSSVEVSGPDLTINTTTLNVKATADNQHGIYARFG